MIDYEKKYRELRAALFALYERYNLTWGSVHIALDDGNMSDVSVAFCAKWAEEDNDLLGLVLAYLLLEMTPEERDSAPVDMELGKEWLKDRENDVIIKIAVSGKAGR